MSRLDREALEALLPQLPEVICESMKALGDANALGAARDYLAASDEDRAGMLAFLECGGPEVIRQLRLKGEDGTPTAGDLEEAMAHGGEV